MNVSATTMSVLAIAVLIFANAIFVAAEFALTTLDRSTVEANARSGGRRDRWIRRAHHRLNLQEANFFRISQLAVSHSKA